MTESLPHAPLLGYRNFWYPVIESRRVGGKPVSVRLLGEDLVLFRAGPRIAALTDRCAHRGSRLSQGRILFPGTLSCPYHGWTYNADGACVARIVEGPGANVAASPGVHAYQTEERHGLVWAFLGEGAAPPLDEDLPPPFKDPNALIQYALEEWRCDWRNVTENYPDMLHAIFVHRNGPEMLFQKVPAWGAIEMKLLEDGKGMAFRGGGGGLQAEYPGLGVFPRRTWFRVLSRRDTRGVWAEVRLPGYIVLPARRDPYLGFPVCTIQWPIPIEEGRTRIFECAVTWPSNPLSSLGLRGWWYAYYRWIHRWFFTHQDRRIIAQQSYRDPETLVATDGGLVQWRRLAAKLAADRARAVSQPSANRGQRSADSNQPSGPGQHASAIATAATDG